MTRLLPEEEREFALGDLAEGYALRHRAAGPGKAKLWYWGQVIRSIGPLLTFETRGWERKMMTGLLRDVRGALRQFRTHPVFATVVVATIALAVGGSTAVFSVLNGVVLRPLDFPDSERVVTLWGQSATYPRAPLTVGDHNDLATAVQSFDGLTAEWGNTALLLGDGGAEQVRVGWVLPNYFEVIRTVPQLGRLLRAEDVNGVVLSHDLWNRRYGSDPDILGRSIQLGQTSLEVVGVLRPDDNVNLTTFAGARSANQMWRLQPEDWTRGSDRSVGWLRSSARLKAGVTVAAAQQEVHAVMDRINLTVEERDGGADATVQLKPVRQDLVDRVAPTLWLVLTAVLGVLLIAAVNVANLMLARSQRRAGEVALRAALGGSRARLFRQFFAESVTLSAIGGAAGLALGWAGMKALVAYAPSTLPRLGDVALDLRVLAFTLAATTATAILVGMLPASRGSRADVAEALGGRTSTASRGEQRLTRALVTAEVALSLGLLVSTGLLLRSLQTLNRTELGFEKEGLLTFALETPELGDSPEEAADLLRNYMDRVAETPGVGAVGVTNRVPLGGGLFTGSYRSEEMVAAEAEAFTGSYRWVTPDFFEAMGARILSGRSFEADEGVTSVIIDQHVADRLWPGQDPQGRRLEHSSVGADPTEAQVVGVVSPMKHQGVAAESPPTVFLPMLSAAHQQNFRYMVVRVAGDPLASVEPIRSALRQVDANAVMARIRPMSELYGSSVSSTRFAGQLLAVFAAVALLLAAVGLHGVMAMSVRRRVREFGIRVALGAAHERILRGVVISGARMVVLGCVLGLGLSLFLARYLGSLLYGIAPSDVVSLTAATVVMLGVGVASAYLPARQVVKVDPVTALKTE